MENLNAFTITMSDFSYIERRWPGAGFEDIDKAPDELVERGCNAVRIDAFPHLIETRMDSAAGLGFNRLGQSV